MWSTSRSEALSEVGLPAPIVLRQVKSAKRLRLRYDEATGTLKLTCPWGISRRRAIAWALDQRAWIDEQLARACPAEPFAPGAVVPLEGQSITIVWNPCAPRGAQLTGDELHVGGPEAGVPRRVENFLKKTALEIMSVEVAQYSSAADVMAAAVTLGDAATRWGSCSSQKRIRLNWRLILAPAEVRRYVVAHEVAHLVHLDHGPQFRALEARLYGPGLSDAKATLRRIGARLRAIGRHG